MAPRRAPSELPRTTKATSLWRLLAAQEISMDVISNFAARFERSREEELSIEDYLA